MDPTHCDLCQLKFSDSTRGWVQTINMKTGAVIETRCTECDRNKRVESFKASPRLTTRMVMDATLSKYHPPVSDTDREVLAMYEPVEPAIKLFEKDVWFGGLQDFARKASVKGTSAVKGDFKLLCWTMCGRAMITIEDKEASVTVITQEDGHRLGQMGMQGIDATGEQAVGLLAKARQLWAEGLRVTEDREVRMAGL